MNGRARLALCLGAAVTAMFGAWRADVEAAGPVLEDPELARQDYVEYCAGCHGVHGSTAPAALPELRGRVGWFMCTPESRAYLLRVPNVAQSRITDNRQLADMMNYVVFVLGNGSAPAGTKPFTGEEVARERRLALTTTALTVERARRADAAIRTCGAPATLKRFYAPVGSVAK